MSDHPKRGPMRHLVAPLLVVSTVLVLTGCSNPAIRAESERLTPAAASSDIQVEVVHTYVNDDPFARFTFKFTNPADKTRVGTAATWKALDKDGVIVGTHDTSLPPIGPGGTWYYVGGAGGANLTGVPAQATIEVTDNGDLRDGAFDSLIKVEKAEFKRAEFDLYADAKSYDVTAVLASTGNVATADINSAVVLIDKKGKAIGGDWLDLLSAPEKLAPGEKLSAKTSVSVSGGKPVKVQVYAWAD